METCEHGFGRDTGKRVIIEEIRRALSSKNLEDLAGLYAEDATLEEVSSLNPPAHPKVMQGREAILKRFQEEILRDPVSGWSRQVHKTEIVDEVETEDRVAFTEVRTYVAGDKAIAQHIARKQNGQIVHDRIVVAWDAD
jgi:hypothetical protein